MGALRSWLGWAGGMVLGAVLLVAAWGKALDPAAFAEQIRAEGLEVLISAALLAPLVIVLEAAFGAALLLGIRRYWVLVPSTALVALFLFLTGRTYWLYSQGLVDASASCGCFGNLVERTPAEAFWQDLLLLVPPLGLAWMGRPRARRACLRIALVATVAAGFALLAWLAPGLPLDDLATRLRPGVGVEELCAGAAGPESTRVCLDTLLPELATGSHLVVISDLGNEELLAAVDRLSEAARAGGERVWLVTDSEAEERQAFFWTWAPAFEIREVPTALLRPLYRRLPRSFRAEQGKVAETFSGIPAAGPE